MNSEIIREMREQYLIISSENSLERERDYRLQMLVHNNIRLLLPAAYSEIDGRLYLYYNTAEKVSVRDCFKEKRVDGQFLRRLYESLADVFDELKKYLITPDHLMLSADDIFVDVLGREAEFVCYPFISSDTAGQLLKLSEYLLSKLKLNDTEAIYYGYAFYQSCAEGNISGNTLRRILLEKPDDKGNSAGDHKEEGRSLWEFENEEKELLNEIYNDKNSRADSPETRKNGKKQKKEKKKEKDFWDTDAEDEYSAGASSRDESTKPKKVSVLGEIKNIFVKKPGVYKSASGRKADDEESWMRNTASSEFARASVVIGAGGSENSAAAGTGAAYSAGNVGKAETKQTARLIPDRNGDSIVLKELRYMVGKECAGADIISSSEKVSRIHARLVKDEGTYLITDMGSKNGTFVNGRKIAPGTQTRLKDRDRIRFGDVEYTYRRKPA